MPRFVVFYSTADKKLDGICRSDLYHKITFCEKKNNMEFHRPKFRCILLKAVNVDISPLKETDLFRFLILSFVHRVFEHHYLPPFMKDSDRARRCPDQLQTLVGSLITIGSLVRI